MTQRLVDLALISLRRAAERDRAQRAALTALLAFPIPRTTGEAIAAVLELLPALGPESRDLMDRMARDVRLMGDAIGTLQDAHHGRADDEQEAETGQAVPGSVRRARGDSHEGPPAE